MFFLEGEDGDVDGERDLAFTSGSFEEEEAFACARGLSSESWSEMATRVGERATISAVDELCLWPIQLVLISRLIMAGSVVSSAGITPRAFGTLGSAPDLSRTSTIPSRAGFNSRKKTGNVKITFVII